MKMNRLIATALLGGAVALANPYQSAKEDNEQVVATGKAAAQKLIQTLGGNLQKEMKAGGPVAAVKFCAEHAFGLTQTVSDELGEGVSVKRVSLKERNPSNRPEADELAVMESLQKLQESGVALPGYLVESVDVETAKFYKPLTINKGVCLKCHGDLAKGELADYIAAMYPGDKATGYKMGDLRGAVVVTIKK